MSLTVKSGLGSNWANAASNPPPLTVGDLGPRSNTVFLGPQGSSIQTGGPRSVEPFMKLHDRVTDAGIIGRISPHLMHSIRLNKVLSLGSYWNEWKAYYKQKRPVRVVVLSRPRNDL